MKRHGSQNLKWEADFKCNQNSSLNQNSNLEPEFEKRARIRIQVWRELGHSCDDTSLGKDAIGHKVGRFEFEWI